MQKKTTGARHIQIHTLPYIDMHLQTGTGDVCGFRANMLVFNTPTPTKTQKDIHIRDTHIQIIKSDITTYKPIKIPLNTHANI